MGILNRIDYFYTYIYLILICKENSLYAVCFVITFIYAFPEPGRFNFHRGAWKQHPGKDMPNRELRPGGEKELPALEGLRRQSFLDVNR